jgi:hypothetical protein
MLALVCLRRLPNLGLTFLFPSRQLDRHDLCKALTEECVRRMVETCVRYLLDSRLVAPSEAKPEIQQQLSKGLSAVILKLSSSETVRSGVMMCAILDNLLLCIPEKNSSVSVSYFVFSLTDLLLCHCLCSRGPCHPNVSVLCPNSWSN